MVECNNMNQTTRIGSLFSLLITFVSAGGAVAADDSPVATASGLIGQGKFAEAVRYCEAHVDRSNAANPLNASMYYLEGGSDLSLKNFEAAKQCFTLVVTHWPTSQEATISAGLLKQLSQAADPRSLQVSSSMAPSQSNSSRPTTAASQSRVTTNNHTASANQNGSSRSATQSNTPTSSSNASTLSKNQSQTTSSQSSSDANLPNAATIYFEKNDIDTMVDVSLNGQPVKAKFDTGGSTMVVGLNQLKEMGVAVPKAISTGTVSGAANGAGVKYWMVPMDVKLGPILKRNFPVEVLEHNATTPLVGPAFLSEYNYTIDRTGGSLRLIKKGGISAISSASGYEVPFTWEGSKMLVTAVVNGHPYQMWFDTGNAASAVSFGTRDLAALGLQHVPSHQVTNTGVSGSGVAYEFTMEQMKLGPIERRNFDCECGSSTWNRPLIGQKFFEGWQYTIDDEHKVIKFLRR